MKYKIVSAVCVVLCLSLCTSCANKSKTDLTPLMGLTWFSDKETVKDELTDLTFITERENTDTATVQYLLDYEDAELLDHDCTLTVCCTEQGFVGLNYHDTDRNNTYRQWYTALEDMYGSATEQGSGRASWYENPVGKNTAVYLFNLQEGVQISFYATEANPDKSYTKAKGEANIEYSVPTPEIRTPIVPDDEDSIVTTRALREGETQGTEDDNYTVYTNAEGVLVTDVIVTDAAGITVTDVAGETLTTAVPVVTTVVTDKDGKEVVTEVTDENGKPLLNTSDNRSTTTTTTTVNGESKADDKNSDGDKSDVDTTAAPIIDHTNDFLLNGLSFYSSPDTERRKMSSYTQLYEYRTEEPGQPWELIMEYENVRYLGKNCDGVLCFTSLGLVGVNYFDSNTSDYSYWVRELTDIYGSPSETQYDYTAWSSNPVGSGTMIYVFALEDGVQISFFADDTGSEIS